MSDDRVKPPCRVAYVQRGHAEELTVVIRARDEPIPPKGTISPASPLALAMEGHVAGDEVRVFILSRYPSFTVLIRAVTLLADV